MRPWEDPEEFGQATAATRKRMRVSEEKAAARLRERGWLCEPPEVIRDLVITRRTAEDE
jgi:hypothetical protein